MTKSLIKTAFEKNCQNLHKEVKQMQEEEIDDKSKLSGKQLKNQLKKIAKENRKLKNEVAELQREKKNIFKILFKKIIAFFKAKPNPIKKFKKHFSARFRVAVEQRNLGFITDEDIMLVIENELSVSALLQVIQKRKEEEAKEKAYYAIISKNKPLVKQLLEESSNELIILQDHLKKLESTYYFDKLDIKKRDNQIERLKTRIEKTNKIIDQLKKVDEQPEQEKRPVGRPKKVQQEKYDDIGDNSKSNEEKVV